MICMHVSFLLIIIGGCVTWLSHDAKNLAGIIIVFSGFALYALSGLAGVIKYFSRRASVIALLILSFALSAEASKIVLPSISRERADSLASRQVEFRGRIVPFSTVCAQLTRKLTGKSHVGKASDVQFVASMVIYPQEWMQTPFLKVKGRLVRRKLGMPSQYIAPVELYDSLGQYRLAEWYVDGESKLDNEILEIDEKMGLLDELMTGRLFTPLPENDPRRLSDAKVSVLMAYDRVQPWRLWFICALAFGIITLVWRIFCGDGKDKNRGEKLNKFQKWGSGILAITGIVFYLWLWIYIGRPPMVGNSEIMIFMAMAAAVIAFICSFGRSVSRSVLWCIAVIMAGGFAMVGWIGQRDVMMSPIMPALDSPWLSVHVSVIMTSYVLLALTLPAAIMMICRKDTGKFIFDMLHPGVYLLGIGIITGSVWADTAWGRYWGWDPKETWALITWLLYALPLHMRCFPGSLFRLRLRTGASNADCTPGAGARRRQLLLGIYLLLPFLSILMTYFGTAYLPGLHSYR